MHQIGVGVLGPVFRTFDPSEDRLVAVKAFHLDITPEQARTLIEALERLVTSEHVHPGVVAPLAVGLEDDVPYMAQEYVAAESLDVAIRHYSPASLETAGPFISQMAASMDAAHERGVFHGALHLRDIFVTPDEARVTGFGIVKVLEEIGLAGPIRRPYTAPEVIAGRGWGGAADRFALAAITYEMLTGRRVAGTGDQVTERIRSIDGVADPEYLEDVFATALSDDPGNRYSSAARFVSALAIGVAEEPADAVGAETENELHRETAPLDLLAGLELRREDVNVDRTLDSVDQLESTIHEDDADVATEFKGREPDDQVAGQERWSDEDASARSGEAADEAFESEAREFHGEQSRDAADSIGAEPRDEHDVGARPLAGRIEVADGRYVPGEEDAEDEEDEYDIDERHDGEEPDAVHVLPPLGQDSSSHRSAWSRGVATLLVIAVLVGSVAYFFGVAFAPDDGPTDEVLESQSVASDFGEPTDPAEPANREFSEEFRAADGAALDLRSVGGAQARATESVVPAPEPPQVSATPAGGREEGRPGTRTIRLPPSATAAIQEPSSPPAESVTAPSRAPEALPATGWLLVRTDPPGATVTLDGVARGQTPLSLRDVVFGTHRLEVSRSGFGTVQRDVTINEQDTVVPVGVNLTPAGRSSVVGGGAPELGSLTVQSRPSGARVTVDGASAGITPLVVALPVGLHQVRIQGDGYQAWATSVEVTAAERVEVNASLERVSR